MGFIDEVTDEQLAMKLHGVYENLAPSFGYDDQGGEWNELPEEDRDLMVATAREVLMWLRREVGEEVEEKAKEADRWWPDEVKCNHCKKTMRIDDEPQLYVVNCQHCGGMVIVEPVKRG